MKHCMVVDDIDAIRKVTRRILENLHCVSSECEDGETALARCKDDMPDAIFVDAKMDGMQGRELISKIRHAEGGQIPHIFYCVSENDFEDIEKAYLAGADAYLVKPFDRKAVEEKLQAAGIIG